jgi:serine/threonine protein kinase
MTQRDTKLIGGVYLIGQVITSGQMLTTYTAYNRNTNDVVGLLVIEFPPTLQRQAVARLLQPLEKYRSIHSPNVIRVYDWGIDGSRAYIATDPPRGLTLRHILDNENIDLRRIIDLTQQMVKGLKILHAQGMAGIDLRPQLITVDVAGTTDRVQIDDVGLRFLLNALGYVNSQRVDDIGFLDTRYAPPEYINGGSIGPESDIYQLGLLLFEMITGRPPFVGKNAAETGVLQSTADVPRMAQYNHETPTSLQDIVDHCLAKAPSMRFASADALLDALDAVQLPDRHLSLERQTDGGLPISPSHAGTSMTNELSSMSKDLTLIEGRASLSSATPQPHLPAGAMETGIYAYLAFEKDGKEAQRFPLAKKDVIVGRLDPKRGLRPDIDLSSIDPRMTISRQHARIRYEETFFYIEDLKSRNKTRLGELTLTPLKPELLQHGDLISFGSVRLIFKIPGRPDKPTFKRTVI